MANHKSERILVWDSSGTMTNSLPERFIICADAYLSVHPDTNLQITPGNKYVTASQYPQIEENLAAQYSRFQKLNPYVQKGKDGYAILEAMRLGVDADIVTEAEFKRFKNSLDSSIQDLFYEEFKNIRREMKTQDREAWYNLQPAFPGVQDAVRTLHSQWNCQYVLTAKEAALVATIVDRYGLGAIIPNNMVRDTIDSKANTLSVIAEENGKDIKDVVFVEDSMPNLKPCYEAGAQSILAGWGYTNDIMRDEAHQLGIPIAENPRQLIEILHSLSK